MRKIILCMLLMFAMNATAQVEVWKAIAMAPRNMQTQEYGKAVPVDMQIIKDGNRQVLIDTARYVVTNVEREIKGDSISSVEFTATNWNNEEFVIKFNHDLYAESPLMRHTVIVLSTLRPYDWTYYFCTENK